MARELETLADNLGLCVTRRGLITGSPIRVEGELQGRSVSVVETQGGEGAGAVRAKIHFAEPISVHGLRIERDLGLWRDKWLPNRWQRTIEGARGTLRLTARNADALDAWLTPRRLEAVTHLAAVKAFSSLTPKQLNIYFSSATSVDGQLIVWLAEIARFLEDVGLPRE